MSDSIEHLGIEIQRGASSVEREINTSEEDKYWKGGFESRRV